MTEASVELIKTGPQSGIKKEREQAKESFYQLLIKKLKKQCRKAIRLLKKKHAATLAWLSQQQQDFTQIKSHAAAYASTGTVAVALFAATATPVISTSLPNIPATHTAQELAQPLAAEKLISKVGNILAKNKTTPEEDDLNLIAALISDHFGINASTQLAGHRLNRVVGVIGAEQHLKRYPQDRLAAHLTSSAEKAMFGKAGISHHKGAFGYFANSKAELTEESIIREKYYLAVQTFLIPGWRKSWSEDKDWFKFRKMLVFNPDNGKAVVAVIADAGPAALTGKHFGGSPEVMHELGLATGVRKGKVVVLFVDDSQNQIGLGPLSQGRNIHKGEK